MPTLVITKIVAKYMILIMIIKLYSIFHLTYSKVERTTTSTRGMMKYITVEAAIYLTYSKVENYNQH